MDTTPDHAASTAQFADTTPKATRYRQPRVLLDWYQTAHLRVLKQLAWVVYVREGIRNADALERRVTALCEPIVRTVLGEEGVTLDVIKARTLEEQGAPITAAKLQQRADKAERYQEGDALQPKVVAAYETVAS